MVRKAQPTQLSKGAVGWFILPASGCTHVGLYGTQPNHSHDQRLGVCEG